MHELAFADAARPTPVVVLILPLRDYSIGHEILLWRRRNPLLTLSPPQFSALPADQQRLAIIGAVIICYNDWARNQRRQRWMRIWGWLIRRDDIALAVAEFRNYLEAGRRLFPAPDPEAAKVVAGGQEEPHGRVPGAPFLAQLVNFAQTELHIQDFGIKTVWDMPYALTAALYLAAKESEGALKVENFKEWDEKENLDRIHREIAEEQKQREKLNPGLATEPPAELTPAAPAADEGGDDA